MGKKSERRQLLKRGWGGGSLSSHTKSPAGKSSREDRPREGEGAGGQKPITGVKKGSGTPVVCFSHHHPTRTYRTRPCLPRPIDVTRMLTQVQTGCGHPTSSGNSFWPALAVGSVAAANGRSADTNPCTPTCCCRAHLLAGAFCASRLPLCMSIETATGNWPLARQTSVTVYNTTVRHPPFPQHKELFRTCFLAS